MVYTGGARGQCCGDFRLVTRQSNRFFFRWLYGGGSVKIIRWSKASSVLLPVSSNNDADPLCLGDLFMVGWGWGMGEGLRGTPTK